MPRRQARAVAGLIAVCCVVELVLQGADHRLWGSVLWRGLAYQYGGFWPGLLHDWQPNFRFQAIVMFATYAFLHAGLGHLVGNMVTLAVVARRMTCGTAGFLALYGLSMLGGAAGYGLLPHGAAPMVGASGAIFGLAGALTLDDMRHNPAHRLPAHRLPAHRLPAHRWLRLTLIVTALAVLNLITWALQGGNLAWQAHLGGFMAGFAGAAAAAAYPRLLAKIRS